MLQNVATIALPGLNPFELGVACEGFGLDRSDERVLGAQALLEGGDDPIDAVARRCGFGTTTVMRHHFSRIMGTSPAAYRHTFRGPRTA